MTAANKPGVARHGSSQVPGGAPLFQRVYTRLGCDGRPPRFRVEFYPYASLVLTIRRREDVVYVRFSDLLRRAPLAVLEGAAALLLARVYRRKAPRGLVQAYLEYARSDRTRGRISRMRRGRVRLASTGPQGRHFDLERMFEELNKKYFEGVLQRPQVGWSTRGWRRQFGCYDPGPNQILLNRRMDRPGVPQVAVEYVLYHEMLHVKHPTRRSGCSLVSHSRDFRAEEKRFAEFERARRILDQLAR
ncbi:MAG TPA: SprT-like domain-containing protein [Candidatus Solibacter sp.]|nr:SprT-like domain-containing protein [Candidatus Solibacter sp.]